MDDLTRQLVQPIQASGASTSVDVDWFVRQQVPLEPGEEFRAAWRESWLVLLWRLLGPLVLANVAAVLFFLTSHRASRLEQIGFGFVLALSFIAVGWISLILVQWYVRIYVLTSRRLIWRQGILWRTRLELSLPKVQNASYSAAMLQKWVGLGTVRVETASVGLAFRIDNVRHALEISQEILKAADEARYQRALMEEDRVRRMLAEGLVAPSGKGTS